MSIKQTIPTDKNNMEITVNEIVEFLETNQDNSLFDIYNYLHHTLNLSKDMIRYAMNIYMDNQI
jgi:phosphate uptake regulator